MSSLGKWLAIVGLSAIVVVITWLPQLLASKSPAGGPVVEVWAWNTAADSLNALASSYTQRTSDVHIDVIRNGTDMQTRFLLSLAGGVGAPDVCQLQEREVGKFTESGRLMDLTDYAARYGPDFAPAAWANCQFDSKTLAIPWDLGPCAVFYKRWVFDRYGVDPDTIETWDDFIAAGKQIHEASGGQTHMMSLSSGDLSEFFQILMQQAGGSVFNDRGEIAMDVPGNQRALEVMRALLDSGTTAQLEWMEKLSSFNSDAVACYPMAVWFGQYIKDYAPDTAGEWGVFRLPALEPGGLRTSNLGGSVLVIPDQGDERKQAWDYVEYVTCVAESQVRQYRDYGLFPAYLPALTDPYFDEPDPFFGGQRVHRLFSADIEKVRPLTRTKDWAEAERYLRQTLSTWAAGMDHQRYLAESADALGRKLGRPVAAGASDPRGVTE
ncbi:MAG: extracellular solute-binding protein [Planctomycetota bacterium]